MKDSLLSLLCSEFHVDSTVAIDSEGTYSRADLLESAIRLHESLANGSSDIIIYTIDPYKFAVAFIASLKSGRRLHLPGFVGQALLDSDEFKGACLLGDSSFPGSDEIPLVQSQQGINDLYRDFIDSGGQHESTVVFHTSGSTGEPKKIIKKPMQLAAEIAVLRDLWRHNFTGCSVCSSVSHQHLYGFLFALCVPLASGALIIRDRVEYPEYLDSIQSDDSVFISSPAFLRRLEKHKPSGSKKIAAVFSSGGPLPKEAAERTESLYSAAVREVLGSTETGGIAYRRVADGESWQPFDGIEITINDEQHLVVTSDYLESSDPYTTQDLAEFDVDGSFRLLGRADSIVKIEEKRVSLNEMSGKLAESALTDNVRVIPLAGRRQYLGAVIVLSPEGKAERVKNGRAALVRALKASLSGHYPPILIPRKWRFVEMMAENDMGKESKNDLDALFESKVEGLDYEITEYDGRGNRLVCRISFPKNHVFFQGHFPGTPILPGIAQAHSAMRIAGRHLGTGRGFNGIPRMKFARPISPDEVHRLEISCSSDMRTISFGYKTLEGGELASKGKIKIGGNTLG